ncbi:MAG: hypothetical protein V3T09_00165 [bacterium]
MVSYPNYKCWEIMNCENLKCPARLEPETPCWEIARRFDFFNFASNICKDCIVFILKEETHVLSKKELHNIIIERGLWKNIGKARQACVLKNDTSSL